MDFMLALAQDMLLSALPAVGFAMVFNVPQRALPWCALLGAIGHGSRMIMVSGAPEGIHRGGSDSYVPGHFSLYGDDLRRQNQPFWLQRTPDDPAPEQLP